MFEKLAVAIATMVPTLARAQAPAYDFEGLGQSWLAELGRPGVGPVDYSVAELLDEHFVEVVIGTFDVRFPVAEIGCPEHADRIRAFADRAVAMQLAWAELTLDDETVKRASKDAKLLRKWIKRWSERDLAKAAGADGPDLAERLRADEKVREALTRFESDLAWTESVGDDAVEARRAQVVVAPSRRVYVQLVAALGILDPGQRFGLWQDASLYTPNAWGTDLQVVPLMNAAHPFLHETALEGWDIDRYVGTSFDQHIAQRLASSLLHTYFDFGTDPLVETALATNLVIGTIGETRIVNDFSSFTWSRAGATTQAYSRFVPGGKSSGGVLPKRRAIAGPTIFEFEEDRNVKEMGFGYFAKNLRERQADGAKVARRNKNMDADLRRDRYPHFELSCGGETYVIRAPFLGEAASEKRLPPLMYLDDYEDFFSVYRSSFLNWLVTESDEGAEHFGEFLARVAKGDSLAEAAEVYETPLGWTKDADSLEGQFLTWISKGR